MSRKKSEQQADAEAKDVQQELEAPESVQPEEEQSELSETEKLQQQLAEANDRLLRQRAEFDNFRKRSFKDLEQSRLLARIDTLTPFIQVFEHLSMAMKSTETSDNIEALKQGLSMILSEYEKAFDDIGVEKFDAVGQKFNPELHEAMSNQPSSEVAEGVVLLQWSSGYKLGGRLLRPARVVVSSGPESK